MGNGITIDIMEGNRARKTAMGWEFDRVALVEGIYGNAYDRLINAAEHTDMPEIGDEHPGYPKALLKEMHPEPITSSQMKVTLVYRTPKNQITQLSWGSVLQDETVSVDVDDNPMTVEDPKGKDIGVQATVGRIRENMVFTRTETKAPGARLRPYSGKVNKLGWKPWPTDAARTWKLSITASTADNGLTYEVVYTFEYNPDTWDTKHVYLNEKGKIPKDITAAGRATFVHFEEADFNKLVLWPLAPVPDGVKGEELVD